MKNIHHTFVELLYGFCKYLVHVFPHCPAIVMAKMCDLLRSDVIRVSCIILHSLFRFFPILSTKNRKSTRKSRHFAASNDHPLPCYSTSRMPTTNCCSSSMAMKHLRRRSIINSRTNRIYCRRLRMRRIIIIISRIAIKGNGNCD